MKRIAVTGGAGHIAYSLLFRIAAGELLGKDQPIALHILELPKTLPVLKGVAMELTDCAFPLLKELHIGSDPIEMFQQVDHAFLVGAKPRGPGMERKDLLTENAKIFVEQGKALNAVANENVTVLVVGNPCNTNCLIAKNFAKRISHDRFFAMTRLDQNRATALLAQKAGVGVEEISHMTIWGNHSSTQVPDFYRASIRGRSGAEVFANEKALLGKDFMEIVQKRGAEIIAARGLSSAASAANAAVDAMRDLLFSTEGNKTFSVALSSDGNPYGIEEGLIFSFPCRNNRGKIEIVSGMEWDPSLREKIALTEKELIEEKNMIQSLLQ